MIIKDNSIDGGKGFDWGKVSEEYVKYRDIYPQKFDLIHHEEYRLNVHFSRNSWHGRMKACRGVGASLSEEELDNFAFYKNYRTYQIFK